MLQVSREIDGAHAPLAEHLEEFVLLGEGVT
jgi:hypothetical protein